MWGQDGILRACRRQAPEPLGCVGGSQTDRSIPIAKMLIAAGVVARAKPMLVWSGTGVSESGQRNSHLLF